LPEATVRALRPYESALQRALGPERFSAHDLEHYQRAWSQARAPTAMINYYRAAMRQPRSALTAALTRPVQAETLVIWGERDPYLRVQLAAPLASDVPNLRRVVRLPDASHWVQQHEPVRVSHLLIEFFHAAQLRPSAVSMSSFEQRSSSG
jgi:pimeloyl-ACP methyl ester carboxylesterase